MIYKSEHLSFTSHPEKGQPFGLRTVISLADGKGTKEIATLNRNGKTLKTKKQPVHNNHINSLKSGSYVPGLWAGMGH